MQDLLPLIMPHIVEAVSVIVYLVIALAANEARRRFGIEIEARSREAVHSAVMTGARAALLEGKTPAEAVRAAMAHAFRSTPEAMGRLKPSDDVLQRLAEAAVAQVFPAAKGAAGRAPVAKKPGGN